MAAYRKKKVSCLCLCDDAVNRWLLEINAAANQAN